MNQVFFIALLVTQFFTTSLVGQSQQDIIRIEFNSSTRGYREQISFTPDSIISVVENALTDTVPRSSARKTSQKEWTRILNCLSEVRLTEIETLESPTMKRAYDGASHSSIVITVNGGATFSHGFDDEEPHKKLKPLISEIHRYRRK